MDGCFIVTVCEVDEIIDEFDVDLRVGGSDLLQRFFDRFGDRDLTRPLGAENREGDHRVAVVARERLRFLVGVRDGSQFGQADIASVRQADRGVLQGLHRPGVAECADRLLASGNLTAAGAKVCIGAAQLGVDVGGGDAEGVQPVRINLDADLAVGAAVAVDAADAGLPLKRALDRVVDEP